MRLFHRSEPEQVTLEQLYRWLTNGELTILQVWAKAGQPAGWEEQVEAILLEATYRLTFPERHIDDPVHEPWIGRSCPAFLAAPCHARWQGCPAYAICPTKGAGRRARG